MRCFFFPCDVDEILKIKLPAKRCADWVAWNFENSGVFLVRSAYRLARQLEHGGENTWSSARSDGVRSSWKILWSVKVPSKVRTFAWKEGGKERIANQSEQASSAPGGASGV